MGDINLEIKIKNLEERTAGEINDTINNIYGTSDQWSSKTSWQAGEICIYNNKLWKCLISNSNNPSEGSEWTQISLKELYNKANKKFSVDSYTNIVDFSKNSPFVVPEDGYILVQSWGSNVLELWINRSTLMIPISKSAMGSQCIFVKAGFVIGFVRNDTDNTALYYPLK